MLHHRWCLELFPLIYDNPVHVVMLFIHDVLGLRLRCLSGKFPSVGLTFLPRLSRPKCDSHVFYSSILMISVLLSTEALIPLAVQRYMVY